MPKQISDRMGKILKDAAKEAKDSKDSKKTTVSASKALSTGARPKARAGGSSNAPDLSKEEQKEKNRGGTNMDEQEQAAEKAGEEQKKQNRIAETATSAESKTEGGAAPSRDEKPEGCGTAAAVAGDQPQPLCQEEKEVVAKENEQGGIH